MEEAIQAGVEDCLYSDSVCLIEWPEIIIPLLPLNVVHLYLQALPDQKRTLRIVKSS